jgi:hypothetical protein
MEFYTNVSQDRGQILFRGYSNGKRIQQKIKYRPYLFINSQSGKTNWKSIYDKPLDKLQFNSIGQAREFIQQYKDVAGFEIHGLTNFVYAFINDRYNTQHVNYDSSLLRIINVDIEIAADQVFPGQT